MSAGTDPQIVPAAAGAVCDAESIHCRFERLAHSFAESTAVICGGRRFTFAELNDAASRVAGELYRWGVVPESLVGVYMPRSAELIAAVLGILKAGGAYVCLDPGLPRERVKSLAERTRLRWMLVHESDTHGVPVESASVLSIDAFNGSMATAADGIPPELAATTTRDHLAAVNFTAGTTGPSKAVAITHANIMEAVERASYAGPEDVCLQAACTACNPSPVEIWGALLNGARLVVVPSGSTVEQLADIVRRERVTTMCITPARLEEIATEHADCFAGVRRLFVDGDALPAAHVRRVKSAAPECSVVHAYGIAEHSALASWWPVGHVDAATDPLPAGSRDSRLAAYILDRQLQPTPLGVTGELYIGGEGLARGYLFDPARTAKCFIPNPFGPRAGSRLCRTGDLARWRPNATLEIVGRRDDELKVKGFRVDYRKVEAACRALPGVRRCAVVPTSLEVGERRLAAYLECADAATAGAGAVAALEHTLPRYMMPSAVVALERLPLTPTGKVDRAALPPVEAVARATDADVVGPRTPLEALLAHEWAQVLGMPRIGVYDSFFECGGHSLLAVQLVSRMRQRLQLDVTLRQLFEAPTVAGMAVLLGDRMGTHPVATEATLPRIVPDAARRFEPFPLTDVQQAYWIGRQGAFELGNVAAHVYFEFDAQDLDVARLNAAWRRLIERHDMLRAVVWADGRQQILPTVPPYVIPVADLRCEAPAVVDERLEATRRELSHAVLPSNRWPLFDLRATLFGDSHVRLHVSLDALIADAMSIRLLARELLQLYLGGAAEAADQAVVPPLELSFRDYVVASGELRNTSRYRQSLDYWRRRLPTLPPAPMLPVAAHAASIVKPRFRRRSGTLSPPVWQRLKARAARLGLTPSIVLLSAYAEVLAYWSKSQQLTINLTLFNRLPLHPQVNDIVGDFTSLTLLAVDLTAHDNFGNRARRIQQQLWEDLDHRYVSGVQVLRELARTPHAAAGAMPVVFTSTLGLAEGAHEGWNDIGAVVYGIAQTPQVWLDHQVAERQGALVSKWDAVEEMFPAGLLDSMIASYESLLNQLANDDAAWTVARRSTLPADQQRERDAVNATARAIPDALLFELFEAQAEQRGDQVAVIAPRRALTYGELQERARLAGRWLRARGARPNTCVAVVAEKGWEQVVAVLGVTMSGAAYLPIDPMLPPARIQHLLAHGGVTLALTQSSLVNAIAWPSGVTPVCVDTDDAGGDASPLIPLQTSDDLAYVIYTSGSTGAPKGVMIDHRGAVNTILDINRRFAVGPKDRVLALSALSFDLSVYDIFGVLAAGGTIVMPDAAAAREPARWLDQMTTHDVTLWNSVPALMQMLVEHARGGPLPPSLRLVLLSGDWIPLTLPPQLRRMAPHASVVSLGGATEASIWSIAYPIGAVEPTWSSVPYGRPLANHTFHVLNGRGEPCPTWVPGELYIGGRGLARGYWQDAERTAERFVAHEATGERLYRTGDWGRYLPGGDIEFLGREDLQVKVQGYRIELGEVEATLQTHPQVRSAVVSAVGPEGGGRRLVGHVVVRRGEPEAGHCAQDERRLESWTRLVDAAHRRLERETIPAAATDFLDAWRTLTQLHEQALMRALTELGVFRTSHERHSIATLIADYRVHPRYRKWLARNLDFLVGRNILCARDATYENAAAFPVSYSLEGLWAEYVKKISHVAESLSDVPEALGAFKDHSRALPLAYIDLAKILTEDIHSAQLYVLDEVTAGYRVFHHCNLVIQEVVRVIARGRSGTRPLSILEIGAGVGTTTRYVLPELPIDSARYVFTDVSNYFIQKARRALAEYPVVEYGLLDIEKSPQAQGYQPHAYDIVIASAVFHATRDIRESLRHAATLLTPDGLLLILEETRFHPTADMFMGLQQGFDRFEDTDIRPSHPLLSRDEWRRCLAAEGFTDVEIVNKPHSILEFLGLDVLIARMSPAVASIEAHDLREFVAARLPSYMVPAEFVFLDALPLTANGKVDRKALTAAGQLSHRQGSMAPRNPMEQRLAEMWCDVLGLSSVGVDDNFFEMGGDSLLAAQLLARMRTSLGVEIPMRTFFESSTIARLADLADSAAAEIG